MVCWHLIYSCCVLFQGWLCYEYSAVWKCDKYIRSCDSHLPTKPPPLYLENLQTDTQTDLSISNAIQSIQEDTLIYKPETAYFTSGLPLFVLLSTDPLLVGSLSSTLLLHTYTQAHAQTHASTHTKAISRTQTVVVWFISLHDHADLPSKPDDKCTHRNTTLSYQLHVYYWVKSHNSLFESDEFLFLLLPALKVSVNQPLQLDQVFVLTFLLNVLQEADRKPPLQMSQVAGSNARLTWSRKVNMKQYLLECMTKLGALFPGIKPSWWVTI